ncbi:hypothetical protein LCGC14_1449690 [marine sediment metagenome]|uniref:Uncharacterized protein n=1 Tax=marine sediment metagenome TaxID=412755 RepID=A0A0F9K4H2_9ZZZZ
MLSNIIKVLVIIFVVLGLLWSATCIYGNFIAQPDDGSPDMPKTTEATHSVLIKNTGGLLLVTDYEIFGDEVGKRTIVLHSFWEVRGKDFKFVDADIVLDEKIFGVILIKRR